MRIPFQMICCKSKKPQRWAEQEKLEQEIRLHGKCRLCESSAYLLFIKVDKGKFMKIRGAREMILKTFTDLNPLQKPSWTKLINKYFGKEYTEKYIGRVI